MPELPEVEALRRSLDGPVSAAPVERAGPAHLATLKTADPPLETLAGRRLAGAHRRGKRLLFPTTEGDLVLLVHLMSAGRLRLLRSNEKRPASPAFALAFQDGSALVLIEPGKRKRAGVWLLPTGEAEQTLAYLGPDALELDLALVTRLCKGERRRLHGFLRDQRVLAGIGRAWANEILHSARLSPFALAAELDPKGLERLARAIHDELERGIALRSEGIGDERVYPRTRQARTALPCLRHPDRPGGLRGAHDLLLPHLPDGRAAARRPPTLPPAPVSRSRRRTSGRPHRLASSLSEKELLAKCGKSVLGIIAPLSG